MTVTDDGPGSPQTASFTGVGVTGGTVTLTSTSLNFGNQTVGVPSSPRPRHPEQQPVRQPDDQQHHRQRRLLADQQLRQVGTGERELHHQCGLHSNHHRYQNRHFDGERQRAGQSANGQPHRRWRARRWLRARHVDQRRLRNWFSELLDDGWRVHAVCGHHAEAQWQLQCSIGVSVQPEPNGDSSIYQSITIPSTLTKATLTFYYRPSTTDTVQYDWRKPRYKTPRARSWRRS